MQAASDLEREIEKCEICAERFSKTHTAHAPRPVAWFRPSARILIAGQAPGMKVHLSGRPFTDPSGDRLRSWLGVTPEVFYDRAQIAIVPMAFCFPGYSASGSDLAPPSICAKTWRDRVMAELADVQLTVIVGSYAMGYHLKRKMAVTEAVADWQSRGDGVFVLPHPSWRNTGWLKKNLWFEKDVVPRMQARVKEILDAD